MTSDADLRSHLLSVLHDLRCKNGGVVPVSDMNFAGFNAAILGRIPVVCEQLAKGGFITFGPTPVGYNPMFVGLAKITELGCDAVEGFAMQRAMN